MSSPWGAIQHSKVIIRGMRFVSTSSHGGIMVTKKLAEKRLSKAALEKALRYGDYYCYEEDCDWAIPVFEMNETWEMVLKGEDDNRKALLSTLSNWNSDYLLDIGITPLEPYYTEYKEDRLREEMHAQHHPDLIISSWGEWHTKTPGVILVQTANDKRYLINSDGYREMGLKLLSKCTIVEEIA